MSESNRDFGILHEVERESHGPTVLVLGNPTAFRTVVQHWLHVAELNVRTARRMVDVPEFKGGATSTGTPWLLHAVVAMSDTNDRGVDLNELRRLCRQATPPIPVIVLTDFESGASSSHWREIAKPVHGETLLHAVAEAVSTHLSRPLNLKYSGHGLLVIDKTLERDAVRDVLEDLGLDVTEAATLREACELLQHVKFDWVLADAQTPDAVGWALLKFIVAFNLTVPLVFGVVGGRPAEIPPGYSQPAAAANVAVLDWRQPNTWLGVLEHAAASVGRNLGRAETSSHTA